MKMLIVYLHLSSCALYYIYVYAGICKITNMYVLENYILVTNCPSLPRSILVLALKSLASRGKCLSPPQTGTTGCPTSLATIHQKQALSRISASRTVS